MTPRNDDVKDITRGAAAVWRNRGILVTIVGLLGLNIGGGVSSYFSGRKPSIDSVTVARAVQAGMEPVLDTLRDHRRDIRDLNKDLDRVAVQADKTDADFRQHIILASSGYIRSNVGRSAEVRR